jgi:hypothetical protein
VLLFGLLAAFLYFANGVRHLLWDAGWLRVAAGAPQPWLMLAVVVIALALFGYLLFCPGRSSHEPAQSAGSRVGTGAARRRAPPGAARVGAKLAAGAVAAHRAGAAAAGDYAAVTDGLGTA